ncbi:pyridoxal 5'-phosphate synthase glutaminase subunit PdxT [Zophobihabitans entericus]|uniref:Pyridoxal 5'-phosphate synthase subunit PdxT n=1 Tax=Zophobihabitans entericus TaxID=1635327 RepID=A0A6G9IDM3_9GAMM|nr:pyridoxal 5'-phosphate synthase glutaminase subunit PdxT [Zophobihabitans entericus]
MKTVGVLALQGAVTEHLNVLSRLQVRGIAVKKPEQLNDLDGLIIPGGESTAIRRLMERYGFIEAIKAFASNNKGLFGTCAGLVLLAERIEEEEACLGLIDCTVRRNGFGRQKESFELDLDIPVLGQKAFPALFIRAPLIIQVGSGVDVLAKVEDNIVAARSGNVLVTAFHPELSGDDRMMEYFIGECLR